MTAPAVLGIDTSCYTTSLALACGDRLLGEARRMLPVPEGSRGLRQSEGFYHHHRHLPELAEQLAHTVPEYRSVRAVAYSAAPRPVEGSYMPVFTAGEDFARTIATVLGVPLIPLTHQEGHIRAASWAAGFDEAEPFLAVHLSGGTTEILAVRRQGSRYGITLLGGTRDISAGMLIDRTGVLMGLRFPAGAAMDAEALAFSGQPEVYPVSVKAGWTNLSGLENSARRQFEATGDIPAVSAAVLSAVTRTVGKLLQQAMTDTGMNRVLFSGGVSSSGYLRLHLQEKGRLRNMKPAFCPPKYSVDNAAGIALMGAEMLLDKYAGDSYK